MRLSSGISELEKSVNFDSKLEKIKKKQQHFQKSKYLKVKKIASHTFDFSYPSSCSVKYTAGSYINQIHIT